MGVDGTGGRFAATLIVDASWCPSTGAGGFGYWIASDRGKRGGENPFRERVDSSNLAEMQAVVAVIYLARRLELVLPGDEVLVQTDSTAAIQGLNGFRTVMGKELRTQKEYRKVCVSIAVELRHVKGHTRRTEARFVANNHCDRRAKIAMQLARKQLNRR